MIYFFYFSFFIDFLQHFFIMSARDSQFDPSGSETSKQQKKHKSKQKHFMAYHTSYNVHDFQGAYHTASIKHQFPIPGSILKQESERKLFMDQRQGKLLAKVDTITSTHLKIAKKKEVSPHMSSRPTDPSAID